MSSSSPHSDSSLSGSVRVGLKDQFLAKAFELSMFTFFFHGLLRPKQVYWWECFGFSFLCAQQVAVELNKSGGLSTVLVVTVVDDSWEASAASE